MSCSTLSLPALSLPALVRAVATVALLLGPGSGIAAAQAFRDGAQAPAHWTQFARLVKFRFEEWIAADDPIADRFRVYLRAHSGTAGGPPPTVTVRAWVNPDGSVERVAFAAFADAKATEDLRFVLTRGNIGEPPPPDMPQPVHLRFTVNAKK